MSDGNDARHEPRERHEPTRLNGQDPNDSHAGNGTVNHGPEKQGPEKQASDKQEAAGELDGLGSDELALRRMLHQAVQDVEPRDGTLEHLRRAVPARRARRRQAAVGMVAAALFVCTAVPALVHVSNSTGSEADPSAVGHASQAQGGSTQGKDPDTGGSDSGSTTGKAEEKGQDGKKEDEKDKDGAGASTGASEGADPSAGTALADAPVCTAAELGTVVTGSEAPDSTGAVYGSFRIANLSATACTVGDPGSVTSVPGGAADPAKVGTQRHAAGDAAAGLPDPSTEAVALLLEPQAEYEVKFAWVPSETCPVNNGDGGTTGGPDPGPSPDPTPTAEPTTDTGTSTGGDTGTSAQLLTEDGTTDGTVTVTYTSSTGAAASVTVSNACAGTVYWTGLLAAQA